MLKEGGLTRLRDKRSDKAVKRAEGGQFWLVAMHNQFQISINRYMWEMGPLGFPVRPASPGQRVVAQG